MSVSNVINSIEEHIQDAYNAINISGIDLSQTNKNIENISKKIKKSFIDIMNNGTGTIYNNFPKVSKTGSNLDLDTEEGKMKLIPKAVQIEQATRILPEEYTQVDYIESSGTQYIDTGINADNNLRVVLDIAYTSLTESNQNIGAIRLQSGNNARYHILSQSGVFKIYVNDAGYNTINLDTNRHLFDIKPSLGIAIIDNQDFTIPSGINDVNLNFWLFGRNSTSTLYYSKVKQWACKMYYNDVLVRDFIPCYRNSDNVVGLYDLVNNEFYTNQGTGAFTYGSAINIPTPDYPQDIHVVTGGNIVNICNENIWDEETQIGYYAGSDGTYFSIPGQLCSKNFTKVNPNTTYYYITPSVNGSAIRGYDKNKNYIGSLGTAVNSFVTPNNCYYIKINLGSIYGGTYNNNVAISLNSTQYVPHQEQNYPISLSSKNLFDLKNENFIKRIDTTTLSISNDGFTVNKTDTLLQERTTVYKQLKPNTTYTISTVPTSEEAKYIGAYLAPVDEISTSAYPNNNVDLSNVATTNSYGILAIIFYFSTSLSGNYTVKNIQLEEGSTATSYEPYYNLEYCKIGNYVDEFKLSTGKNLFKVSYSSNYGFTYTCENDVYTLTPSVTNPSITFQLVNPIPAGTYYYSGGLSNSISFRDESDTNITSLNGVEGTITVNVPIYYIRYSYIATVGTDITLDLSNTQIESGTEKTEWEPYGIGEWYLKKNIVKYIFEGNTSIDNYVFNTDLANVLAVNLIPNKVDQVAFKYTYASNKNSLFSDKFIYKWSTSNEEHIYVTGATEISDGFYGNIRLYINHERLSGYSSSLTNNQKRDLVVSWLQQNPLTTYYIAKTPSNIHISEENYPTIKQQLENIYNNAKSYEDKTYITVTNDNEESLLLEVEVTALKSINTIESEGE